MRLSRVWHWPPIVVSFAALAQEGAPSPVINALLPRELPASSSERQPKPDAPVCLTMKADLSFALGDTTSARATLLISIENDSQLPYADTLKWAVGMGLRAGDEGVEVAEGVS